MKAIFTMKTNTIIQTLHENRGFHISPSGTMEANPRTASGPNWPCGMCARPDFMLARSIGVFMMHASEYHG